MIMCPVFLGEISFLSHVQLEFIHQERAGLSCPLFFQVVGIQKIAIK